MTAVSGRGADVMTPVSERHAHVLGQDVMTVVSERGAHVLLLEAAMSLLVRALLLVILFSLKVVMLEEVLVASLSLFTSPPTPTTRPCGACLTQNISKAGDPDLGRGERTHWGRNLPVARCLFLLARHQEGPRVINLCFSDRGCLFPFTRYGPPRDARHDTPPTPYTLADASRR